MLEPLRRRAPGSTSATATSAPTSTAPAAWPTGATLTEVTAEIAAAWGLGLRLLPVTDDPLRTMVTVADEGEIGFQEYFVGRQHAVPVTAVRFDGADGARPAPGVLEAIARRRRRRDRPVEPDRVDRPGAGRARRAGRGRAARATDVVAVSPIIAGAALKGPADRLLARARPRGLGGRRGPPLRRAGAARW